MKPAKLPTNSRMRNAFTAAGLLMGMAAAATTIMGSSGAAFSAKTENVGNTWKAAQIALADDDTTTMMYNVSGMIPGQTETRCIQVTYTGTASAITPIKLYSALTTNENNFANYLNVTVEQGSGATFGGSCAGFSPTATIVNNLTLATMATNIKDFGSGVGTFIPPATGSTVSYRFTVNLDNATPNTSQGNTAGATFTWEIQTA